MKYLISITIIIVNLIFFISCQLEKRNITEDVLKTVKAHNYAWSTLEDVSEQGKYVHDNIVFIAPPYKTPVIGKEQYLIDYQGFMDHAKVHYFNELDPKVMFHNNNETAIVVFQIDMSFEFGDESIPSWQGMDIMTLVYKNSKWLIASDMYAGERVVK